MNTPDTTPRPWTFHDHPTETARITNGTWDGLRIADVWCSDLPDSRGNGPLIVEAVNAYDSLQETIDALNAEVTQLRHENRAHRDRVLEYSSQCDDMQAQRESIRAQCARLRADLARVKGALCAAIGDIALAAASARALAKAEHAVANTRLAEELESHAAIYRTAMEGCRQ